MLLLCYRGLLEAAPDPDLGDHPEFSHAMEVETRKVDGVPVVFQFGEIRPDFESLQGSAWRQRTSLDGDWELRFEGEEASRAVTVPHSWEAMAGSKFWDQDDISLANPARFDGAGWYRKEFESDKEAGKRYRLEFRGVRERARVWLNGKQVAMHEGLGAPFSIDVTDEIRSGVNELKVKVLRLASHRKGEDDKWHEIEGVHTPYPKAPDYWPYAGITGSVALWEEGEVTIRKLQVRPQGDTLQVRAFVSNTSKEDFLGKIRLQSEVLKDEVASKEVSIARGKSRAVSFELALQKDAARWHPESPNLHQLVAQLQEGEKTVDGCDLTFGLREFVVDGQQLLLNGKPIFLNGVAAYSETEDGVAITREEHRRILSLAQEAGANFVRLPVRQRDPVVYQLADEMGLMLTGEWGGFWYKEKAMGAQTKDPHSVFQSMGKVAVWDLMNRPSVVLWCTNNECHQFCPEYEPFVKMNNTLVREIDQGLLPVTWAAWHPHKGEPHFEWADIVGFNEYRGAMDPFEDLDPDMEKVIVQNPNKPIVIMENGAWAKQGRRGEVDQRGTEDWQADLLKRQWEVLRQHTPPLAGYTYWILKDYRSRKTYTGNRRANGWSGMGMYSEDYQPKMARDTFQELDWSPKN